MANDVSVKDFLATEDRKPRQIDSVLQNRKIFSILAELERNRNRVNTLASASAFTVYENPLILIS